MLKKSLKPNSQKPSRFLDTIRKTVHPVSHKILALPLAARILLGVVIIVVIVGAAAGVRLLYQDQATKQPNAGVKKNTPRVASCTLPIVDVKANAFTLGVPKGWLYELNNGTVSVMKDTSNTTGAFLYTAKLHKDMAATEFLTASAGFFSKAIASEGGTFNVENVKAQGAGASGTIVASLDGTSITGLFTVQKESDFVTLRAYYAPKADMAKSKATLEQVTSCYSRTIILTDDALAAAKASQDAAKNPSGFSHHQGRYFDVLLPSDFKVTGETDSGLDMSRNDMAAGFSYAYVTGAEGSYTPQSWAQYALPRYASIKSLSLGTGKNVSTEVPGMTVQEFDFTGSLSGTTAVRGKVTVGVITTTDYGMGSSTSAFWAIQVAKPSVWGSVADTLQQVQNSVTITDIGDTRRKTMLPPNRPMDPPSSDSSSITSSSEYRDSVNDEASEGWAEGMRGYVETKSPSTGETYDVPLNAWDPSGPQGAGFYRQLPGGGGVEKLE